MLSFDDSELQSGHGGATVVKHQATKLIISHCLMRMAKIDVLESRPGAMSNPVEITQQPLGNFSLGMNHSGQTMEPGFHG